MKKIKKGISLITLVITIIVVIILAGVVILSLQKNNPIKQASKAKFLNDVETFKEDLELYKQNQYLKNNGQFDPGTLNVPVDGLDIYDVIPSLKNSSYGKNDFKVEKGKLVYQGTNKDYQDWSKDSAIEVENQANIPELVTGMTPIEWNGTTLVTTTTDDTNWYSYTTTNKQWANAQTADGSMWVWIPRYEYKIASLYHQSSSSGGEIDIKFIQKSQTTADSGYIIQPAFTFGNTQLSGIWVAKFEASGSASSVEVKPNVNSLRSITISDMFKACRNMEANTSKYGWSSTNIDTHLMKNLEWGSVAYLAQSVYGKNSEVTINDNSSYYTGGGADNAYITNVAESTTGNVYGIYDMSGGALEYVAAYVNNGNSNLTTYGSSLVNADAKYKDVYTSNGDAQSGNYSSASSKIGDAVYETSSSENDGAYSYYSSWYSDYSCMPYSSYPFFVRGGDYSSGSHAGLFGFGDTGGDDYNGFGGFRPVMAVVVL